MRPCIYCPDGADDSDEHLLPEAIGYFGRATRRNDLLCDGCNGTVGRKLYHRLFHIGYYAMARTVVPFFIGKRRAPRRGRTRSKPFRPIMTDQHDGLPYYVETDPGGLTGRKEEQILFRRPGGAVKPYLIPEGVDSAKTLRKCLQRAGHINDEPISLVAEDLTAMTQWLKEIFPGKGFDLSPDDESGRDMRFVVPFDLGEREQRAMAAVALHTFLVFYGSSGHSRGLTRVKSFVRDGGGRTPVMIGDERLLTECGLDFHDEMPTRVKHLFMFAPMPGTPGGVMALAQLFRNSQQDTPWWAVILDATGGRVQHSVGVSFTFFDDCSRDLDGETVDGDVFQLQTKPGHVTLAASGQRLRPRDTEAG